MFEIVYDSGKPIKSERYTRPKCSCGDMRFKGDVVRPAENEFRFGFICATCGSNAVMIIIDPYKENKCQVSTK